jgi:hypothetical protein
MVPARSAAPLPRFVRPITAVIVPLVVQAVWVEFLLGSPVSNAPPALVVVAYWLWWLSIPACAVTVLFVGYQLFVRDYPDPRLDFAMLYFTIGVLVLLTMSGALMINP